MKYDRFEDLPVWQAAIELVQRIYAITRDRFFAQPGDLCDQLRRAALSISNNIAEGFERGSTAELLAFLYYARGSAGEVRSMLHFVASSPEATPLKFQISSPWPSRVRVKYGLGPTVCKTATSAGSVISPISRGDITTLGSARPPFVSGWKRRFAPITRSCFQSRLRSRKVSILASQISDLRFQKLVTRYAP